MSVAGFILIELSKEGTKAAGHSKTESSDSEN
jgi:hypothetical protein